MLLQQKPSPLEREEGHRRRSAHFCVRDPTSPTSGGPHVRAPRSRNEGHWFGELPRAGGRHAGRLASRDTGLRGSLLRQGGAPPSLSRAAVVFISVSLAIGQPPAAAGLARRMHGALGDSRVVSVGLLVSSVILLALAVAMAGILWTINRRTTWWRAPYNRRPSRTDRGSERWPGPRALGALPETPRSHGRRRCSPGLQAVESRCDCECSLAKNRA